MFRVFWLRMGGSEESKGIFVGDQEERRERLFFFSRGLRIVFSCGIF